MLRVNGFRAMTVGECKLKQEVTYTAAASPAVENVKKPNQRVLCNMDAVIDLAYNFPRPGELWVELRCSQI